MALQLNGRQAFKEFPEKGTDSPTTQMPLLIKDGRIPIGLEKVFAQRLNALNGAEELRDWVDNYFFLGDGVLYHPDTNIKVVRAAQFIRDLSPETPRVDYAVALGKNEDESVSAYNALEGSTFTREELAKYGLNRGLSNVEAKKHPVFKILEPVQTQLDLIVDATFGEIAKRNDKKVEDVRAMGVYLANPSKVAAGRLWVVLSLDNNSDLRGDYSVDSANGRLVGVAPEALVGARGPSIELLAQKVIEYCKKLSHTDPLNEDGIRKTLLTCYK